MHARAHHHHPHHFAFEILSLLSIAFKLFKFVPTLLIGSFVELQNVITMKDIKSDWRSILAFDRTKDLMNILCSADIKHYNPYEAIQLWLSSGLILCSHLFFCYCASTVWHGTVLKFCQCECVLCRAVPCQPTRLHQPCRTVRHRTTPHSSKNLCLTSTRVSQAPTCQLFCSTCNKVARR